MTKIFKKHRVVILIVNFIIILVNTMCASQIPETMGLPITLAYLDEKTITFACLNQDDCFQNFNLDNYVEFLKSPLYIGPVFYLNSASIFVILSFWDMSGAVLKINTATNQVNYLDLPTEIDPDLSIVAYDRVVLANRRRGEIFIIQDDLSAQKVEVGPYIIRLVETTNMKVMALSNQLIEKEGEFFTQVSIIDVNSGRFVRKLLKNPSFDNIEYEEVPRVGKRYAGKIVNVSMDLTKLYYLYYSVKNEDKICLTLAMFDANTLKEENSVSDVQCINMTGYTQYHNVLYSSRISTEGNERATLINMSNLQPLIDLSEIMKNELTSSLMITPFNDYFVLNTNSRIIILSLSGAIVQEYSLPIDWIARDYVVMEYRK